MQTLQISDQAASQLNEMASKKHISTSILIEQLIKNENEGKKPILLTDVIKDLPTGAIQKSNTLKQLTVGFLMYCYQTCS